MVNMDAEKQAMIDQLKNMTSYLEGLNALLKSKLVEHQKLAKKQKKSANKAKTTDEHSNPSTGS